MDENKDLLIKDLCTRLPYGVKCEVIDRGIKVIGTLNSYTPLTDGSKLFGLSDKEYDAPDKYWQPKAQFSVEEIKPYLRSIRNMTEDEENELSKKYNLKIERNHISIRYHSEGYWDDETECPTEEYLNLFDWFNKHHFDYRDLIEKGLAIEAPEGIY